MKRNRFRSASAVMLAAVVGFGVGVPASASAEPLSADLINESYSCRLDVHPYDPVTPGDFVHVASITEAPNGDLLYAFYGGSDEFDEDKNTWVSRMVEGTGTWQAPVLAWSSDMVDGNPVIWTDKDGLIYLFFSTIEGEGWDEAVIDFIVSADNGHTWSPKTVLVDHWGWNIANRPFYLSNGEAILPVYDEINNSSGWLISTDGFQTWTAFPEDSADWPTPGIQPATVELEDGHLLAYMRTGEDFVYETESFDFGRTWTAATPTVFPNRGARVDLLKLENGNLVFGMNPVNNSDNERSPMRVLLSEDGGETWPHFVDVETNRDERYQYPYLMQSSDGFIHLGYSHTRRTKNMRSVIFTEEFIRSGEDITSNPASGRRENTGDVIATIPVEQLNGVSAEVEQCSYRLGLAATPVDVEPSEELPATGIETSILLGAFAAGFAAIAGGVILRKRRIRSHN